MQFKSRRRCLTLDYMKKGDAALFLHLYLFLIFLHISYNLLLLLSSCFFSSFFVIR
ncbi:hypothetical protein CLOBOL_04010 [Enterocloster bolteae ATCC BAA-613]|uniref:Uncharacterized protein n=1 Tax=Enterocloster bolteae (strain ATCC BAA-613 / DSM 15670 / CCUG 46953 / JCM 12243 / WAL 16351) TaxID=411902 RepID=A8RUG4_ENTBW|nr:hypothetical protein CLOBOL_04010 [Enterocloster bolteae ATCC BAA-613]